MPARDVNQYQLIADDYVDDPYPTIEAIRDECPVGRSTELGGSWMPVTYDAVQAMAADTDRYSSDMVLVVPPIEMRPPPPHQMNIAAPPITSDPPEHLPLRKLILPYLSPGAVKQYEQGTRDMCNRLIDGFIDEGRADAATDYAQQIPVRVIADILGIGDGDHDMFVGWVRAILEQGHIDPERRYDSRVEMLDFFAEQIEDRRANPRDDDMFTQLCETELDGEPLPDHIILGIANLMLIAGIDTTWSSIGSGLWHLAQHPAQREQLRANPDLWPRAVEELLRAYSPVTMGRRVTADHEFEGCPMNTDDRVIMSFPAANRDPAMFEHPDEVDFERSPNRHIAFGSGIHRCAGSNLARLELRVALQTWMERIPDFELEDPDQVTWAGGQVRGPRICHVTF